MYHLYIRPSPIYPSPNLIYCLYIVKTSFLTSLHQVVSENIAFLGSTVPSKQSIYHLYISPKSWFIAYISSKHHFWDPCTVQVVPWRFRKYSTCIKSSDFSSIGQKLPSTRGGVPPHMAYALSKGEPDVVGVFGSKVIFGCQENVQKVSKDSNRWFRFGPRAKFYDSSKQDIVKCANSAYIQGAFLN